MDRTWLNCAILCLCEVSDPDAAPCVASTVQIGGRRVLAHRCQDTTWVALLPGTSLDICFACLVLAIWDNARTQKNNRCPYAVIMSSFPTLQGGLENLTSNAACALHIEAANAVGWEQQDGLWIWALPFFILFASSLKESQLLFCLA